MPNRPVDVDVKQSIKDIFLTKNEYHLVDDYVLKGTNKHPFAILVPGGGYGMVCSFIEGVPIAKKLNEKGISAFILYYRTRKKAKYPAPMDDLARAVKEIFDKAEEYNLDTNNYSIWGASAGGHLVSSFGTDNIGYLKYGLPKPGTLVLIYPVITMNKEFTHLGTHDTLLGSKTSEAMEYMTSVEKHIHKDYPKTFVWCSQADKVVPYRLELDKALNEHNIPHELKIYENVDHGVGPGTGTSAEGWINEAIEFWRGEE